MNCNAKRPFLKKQLAQLEALCKARDQEKADTESRQARMGQELETYREFAREPEIRQRLTAFLQEQQAAEQQRQEEERQRAAIAEQDRQGTPCGCGKVSAGKSSPRPKI